MQVIICQFMFSKYYTESKVDFKFLYTLCLSSLLISNYVQPRSWAVHLILGSKGEIMKVLHSGQQ